MNLVQFSPLKITLQDDQRLKVKNGLLYVESSKIRAEGSFFKRLFTRGEYSQNKILNRIHQIAKNALQGNEDVKSLSRLGKTYNKLIERAQKQNETFNKIPKIIRWIIGKSHIKLESHQVQLAKIQAKGKEPKLEALKKEFDQIKEKPNLLGQIRLKNAINEYLKKNPGDAQAAKDLLKDVEKVQILNPDPFNLNQPIPNRPRIIIPDVPFINIEEGFQKLKECLPEPLNLEEMTHQLLGEMEGHFEQYANFQKHWNRVSDKDRQDPRLVELKGRFDKESQELAFATFNHYEKLLSQKGIERDFNLEILENADEELIEELAKGLEEAVNEIKLYLAQLQNEPILNFVQKLEGALEKLEYEIVQNGKAQERIDFIANKKKLEQLRDDIAKENEEFFQKIGDNPAEAKELVAIQRFYKHQLNKVRGIEPNYGEDLFNQIAGNCKADLKKGLKKAKANIAELIKKRPELAEEIKKLLHPQDEMKVEEALQIMEEACNALKEMKFICVDKSRKDYDGKPYIYNLNKHFQTLKVFINVGKHQRELLEYVANTPKGLGWGGHIVHKDANAVGEYLREKTKDWETGKHLVFHAELQNQEHHIKQAPAIYARAYNFAKEHNLLEDFFKSTFDGSNACIEGNIGQITEWLEDADPTMDPDLNLGLSAKDDIYFNIGRFNDVFTETQFRAYHLAEHKVEFTKREYEHKHRRTVFKSGRDGEAARKKWLTQAQFVKFMEKEGETHFPIKYKGGEITKETLLKDIQHYQDICVTLY